MAPFEADRDTQKLLLGHARDLLVREGFGGFSLRKVASLANVSPTAVYRHFEDKEALLSEATRQGAMRFTSYLVRALAAPTPRERLRELGLQYYAFALENKADYELLFVIDCAGLGLRRLDEQGKAESNASFRLLVDRVLECQSSGDLRAGDAEQLALTIWSGVHGMVSLFLSGHIPLPEPAVAELFRSHIDDLVRGLSP